HGMSSLRFDLKKTKRKDVEVLILLSDSSIFTASDLLYSHISFDIMENQQLHFFDLNATRKWFIPDSFVTGEARNHKLYLRLHEKAYKVIIVFFAVYGASKGPISVHELNTFRHLPKEGAVYELSGFDVSRSNPNYRLSDSPFSVQFTDLTSFVELSNPVRIEHLRLRNYDQLMVVANTNTDLPDTKVRDQAKNQGGSNINSVKQQSLLKAKERLLKKRRKDEKPKDKAMKMITEMESKSNDSDCDIG
ncbi:hypothetical protein HID58_071319, partial [Brassica napus]